jgi:hypothetical protein
LREWRDREFAPPTQRPKGYPELSATLGSKQMNWWEYHPVRLGWASLLFPAHQTAEELGRGDLISAAKVAVCWDRANQAHSNCGGLDAYLLPKGHSIQLRAVGDDGVRLLDGECSWAVDAASGAHFERAGGTPSQSRTLPCAEIAVVFVPSDKQVSVTLQSGAGQATATVGVTDVLVVGIGDSFSSGEGNPDVPAKLGWAPSTLTDWAADGGDIIDSVTYGPVRKAVGDYFAAQWIDRSCHRSAYSYQLRSALHLALEDGHRAITFLGYACSGAEINEGLFQPWQGPEYTTSKEVMPAFRKAQLSLMLNELCGRYDGTDVYDRALTDPQEMEAIRRNQYKFGGTISDTSFRCARQPAGKGFKRKIDLLYASVGGNDLGFARWIMASITKEGFLGAFLPTLKPDSDAECRGRTQHCRETRDRWTRFNARYELFRDFVDTRVSFSNRGVAPVLFFTYPVPLRDTDGSLCPGGNSGLTVFTSKPDSIEPRVCLTRRHGNLQVLETIEAFTESKLNGTIAELVRDTDGRGRSRSAWRAITDYRPRFANRGFCASTASSEPFTGCKSAREVSVLVNSRTWPEAAKRETLHLPSVTGGTEWKPFHPVWDFRPYQHRNRLLRTMNETHFLINQLKSATQQSKASGVLSLKDSATAGSFHPTAEAHAIFADGFLTESRAILAMPLQAEQ